jgi:HAE1 family hydrophobic/amphiphilic exporter-1
MRLKGQTDLARGRLNAMMLRPIETPVVPSDSLEYLALEMSVEQAVQQAWSNRPEAKAIALAERIRDELIRVARADARPSLELTGVYGYSVRQPENFLESDFSKWSASVTLKVPLFDGYRTAGRVAQARAERDKLTQDRLALENQIRLDARDAVDVLNVARSIYEAAELNVAQAWKALDMTQASYNHGAATLLDVLDAQAALTLAESNRIEALHAHANARAVLRFVMAQDPLDPPPATRPEAEDRS